MRYLDERARRHIEQLKAGDFLQLKPDDDNVHDRYALGVQTEEPVRVGYCPRYLNRNLRRAMDVAEIKLMVERVNPEAPLQFRLLCKAVFMPPPSFDLFATDAYQPLAEEAAAA
ncbi:MAG: HIRAN domain-containing protein [Gammaproteobacteria bacterium]